MAIKIILGAVVAMLMGGIAFGFYKTLPSGIDTMAPESITSIAIGTTTIPVEVASTNATREQGLSGRASLPQGAGMLFVFESPGNYGFWMKDMLFSLDMFFIDSNGTVVTLDQDVTPESYRTNPPKVFFPRLPISYVLEVPAGFAEAHNLAEGMHVVFQ